MKILITGAAGQLGTELLLQLGKGGSVLGSLPAALINAVVVAVDRDDADLACFEEASALLKKHRPDVVINCAAFTNVDTCEAEPDTAFAANALVPRNLAITCNEINASLLHVSTDYVFKGDGKLPLTEAEPTRPQSVYGKTKLLGEEYARQFCSKWFIIRTSWLYGRTGNNFVKTMLRLGATQSSLSVVDDQLGNPTNAEDLAHHILKLAASQEYGVYHATGNGTCSWYDLTCEIMRLTANPVIVKPCTTAQFPRPAKRPAFSSLDNAMLRLTVGDDMRTWQEALAGYFANN